MDTKIIFIIVVAIIFAILLILKIISWLKGKIIIQLSQFDFAEGGTISGKIILQLRKQIQAKELIVGLRALQKIISGRGKQIQSTSAVYDSKQSLQGSKIYPKGETSFDFSIKVPKGILPPANTDNPILDGALKSVKILVGSSSFLKWYVYASLEVAGWDLRNQVHVNVHQ